MIIRLLLDKVINIPLKQLLHELSVCKMLCLTVLDVVILIIQQR